MSSDPVAFPDFVNLIGSLTSVLGGFTPNASSADSRFHQHTAGMNKFTHMTIKIARSDGTVICRHVTCLSFK